MHPDVRKLYEVQKVDQRIAKIRRDLDAVPAETTRRERSLGALQQAYQALYAELQECEVAMRGNETSIAADDEELKKLETRLNSVRNNAEYQATLLQMESVRSDRNRLEESVLEMLERVEALKEKVADSKEKLGEAEKIHAEYLAEADKLLADRRQRLEEVSHGRDDMVTGVPPDLMARYGRLFDARDSLAVCAMEGNTCTGCYTSIPPNLQVKLHASSAVVCCDTCQRILYIPE